MTTTASSEPTGTDDVHTYLGHGAALLTSPMASTPSMTPSSRLGPKEPFPEDLAGLGMAALQVLHSRITRQLDHDYLTEPTGPHCTTLDRCQELAAELDTRDGA